MKKEDIAKLFNISRQTLNNWEKDKPELFKIITQHFEEKKNKPDYESIDYMKQEINIAFDNLPRQKAKKFYHLIMAELTEFE